MGHVERCHVLLHMIDVSSESVEANYHLIRKEIESYGKGLAEKPEIVVLTKKDLVDEGVCAEKVKAIASLSSEKVFSITSQKK